MQYIPKRPFQTDLINIDIAHPRAKIFRETRFPAGRAKPTQSFASWRIKAAIEGRNSPRKLPSPKGQ